MIISIDPGERYTGMAFRLDNGHFATVTIEKADDATMMVQIFDLIKQRSEGIAHIVVEDFLGIQYRDKHGIAVLKLIGNIEAMCHLAGIAFSTQTPAQRKSKEHTAVEHLEVRKQSMGLRYTNHEVSAMAHLLRYESQLQKDMAKLREQGTLASIGNAEGGI